MLMSAFPAVSVSKANMQPLDVYDNTGVWVPCTHVRPCKYFNGVAIIIFTTHMKWPCSNVQATHNSLLHTMKEMKQLYAVT